MGVDGHGGMGWDTLWVGGGPCWWDPMSHVDFKKCQCHICLCRLFMAKSQIELRK